MAIDNHELQRFDTNLEGGRAVRARSPMSSTQYSEAEQDRPVRRKVDADLDRRTVRKLDFILLPFLALLFLCNSLDKSNIGNAETANFTADIGLEKDDLNDAVAVFFAFFVTFQPIGAALGRHYGMSIWVPGCMSVWGVCTALHVWVRAKWQLVVLRMVIGILEAGFYPVTVSYLSLFYTKFEFGRRLAIFYGQSALAGALGGILSYFVFSMFPSDGTNATEPGAWKSWQVLFLLEGCITVIIAVTGFFWLPRSARTAWFFRPDERAWAEERIKLDNAMSEGSRRHKPVPNRDLEDDEEDDTRDGEEEAGLLWSQPPRSTPARLAKVTITDDRGLSQVDVVSACIDWKIWYLLICNILSAIPVSAFSVFLPLVLQPLTKPRGSANNSQPALTNLLTAPPFLLGWVVLFVFTTYSDRHRTRLFPMLLGLAILLFGLTLTTLLPPGWVVPRYLSLCILVSGSFIASPLQVAWLSNNIWQPGKRSIALGINGWGNLAGVFSALLFRQRYAPRYQVPFFVTFVLVGIAVAGYAYFRAWVIHENQRRDREGVKHKSRTYDPLGRILRLFDGHRMVKLIGEARETELMEEEAMSFRYGL